MRDEEPSPEAADSRAPPARMTWEWRSIWVDWPASRGWRFDCARRLWGTFERSGRCIEALDNQPHPDEDLPQATRQRVQQIQIEAHDLQH